MGIQNAYLSHLSIHFIPGRNWTCYAIFLACLATYLFVLDRRGGVRSAAAAR